MAKYDAFLLSLLKGLELDNPDARQTLLLKGLEMIHQGSYHGTSIHDICKAADVPKGSFFCYCSEGAIDCGIKGFPRKAFLRDSRMFKPFFFTV